MSQQQLLAILLGGGPAPGINSVIASATIRAILQGVEVIGIRDGFEEPLKLAKIAESAGMSVSDFRKEFEYLIETELPPIVFGVEI